MQENAGKNADQNNFEYGLILSSCIVEGYFIIRLFSLSKLFNNKDNKYRNVYIFAFCEKKLQRFF